jgi:hypothetical protein
MWYWRTNVQKVKNDVPQFTFGWYFLVLNTLSHRAWHVSLHAMLSAKKESYIQQAA